MITDVPGSVLAALPPALAYAGVFFIGFISNMFVPVPEELVFIALGYLVGGGSLWFIPTVLFIILGCLVNDIMLYYLARRGNRFLTGIYNRLFAGLMPLDSPFLLKHLKKVVIISRFLIQFRFLGPFFSGTLHVPIKKFIAWDLIALAVYVPIFVGLGAFFQARVEHVLAGLGSAHNIMAIVGGFILTIALLQFARTYVLKWFKKVASRFQEVPTVNVGEEEEI
jgi:membrane-associated protein